MPVKSDTAALLLRELLDLLEGEMSTINMPVAVLVRLTRLIKRARQIVGPRPK
jgi:hypothetical protein